MSNWVLKNNIFGRNILLHQHNNIWVETYHPDDNYYCCQCDEKYHNSKIVIFAGVISRPNNRSYWEINHTFNKKSLKINPTPQTDPGTWDSYGHAHEDEHWRPIKIAGHTVCPQCLEIAPAGSYGDLVEVTEVEKGFWTEKKIDEKTEKVKIHYV